MNPRHPLFLQELQALCALELPIDRLRGKTVAVTGATGLIGSSFLRALHAVSRAHSLNLRPLALCRNPERARIILADLEDLEYLPYDAVNPLPDRFRADYILHAAANAHPAAFSADPAGTLRAGLLGTMHLLENIRANGGRLLFCSTGEIYGENPAIEAFDEHSFGAVDPMRARACYPEGKRAAEALCAAYADQYGVDVLAARLCYVYGPAITKENSRADAQFLRRALAGEDIIMKSPGSQIRSYCYAADAATALLTLMLKGEAGQAYNIANPMSVSSIRNYAQTLAGLAGVQLRFELPPEAEQKGYSTVTRAVLNPEKLMALGWKPLYDLETGLKHTLEISRECASVS